MRYAILGPVEITAGTQTVTLERPQRRALLALLLLHANQVVSIEQLIEALWGGVPPATARAQLHALVAAVRRTLREAGAGDTITTRAGGYVITVAEGACDLEVFGSRTAQARAAADPDEAARLLREALTLWRGVALDGISAAFVEAARAGLEEQRLAAHEQLADIELARGRHAELVPELTALVAANPLRERLVGQLMVALYRSGRQSEALQAARALRRVLAEEEGLDPGPRLVELETAILRADPVLAAPGTAAPARGKQAAPHTRTAMPGTMDAVARLVPKQLPAGAAHFAGRREQLAHLDALLPAGDGPPAPRPAVATIAGAAGMGKTSLAVHWAHQVVDRFPDGQLHLDLRHGAVTPAEAVDEALRALGVPADRLPTDAREAAAGFQSLLGARRMLVLLDNAGSDEQVRALLPESGPSVVLITSRSELTVGARIRLEAPGTTEATELLGAVAGADRVGDEPAAAAQLARSCRHLPLALAIAGASLTAHPERTVAEQVALVGARLERGSPGPDDQAGVRAAFEAACDDLPPPERRLVRLLAVAPAGSVTAGTAAALADSTVEQAAQVLARLTTAGLLAEPLKGRFALHEPLFRYAAGIDPAAHTDAEEQSAVGRLLAYYLHAVDAAAHLLYPQTLRLPMPDTAVRPGFVTFAAPNQATSWLDAERASLVAVIEHAAQHGPRSIAWLLADALRGYFSLALRTADWRRTAHWALTAAETDGDAEARSAAHLSLAELHLRSSQHPDAWQEAWRVLATTGRTRPRVAGAEAPRSRAYVDAGTARRLRPGTRALLAGLGILMVYTTVASSTPTTAADVSLGTGPAKAVSRWSVAGLRQDEAIDFDAAGRQSFDDVQGMDITPWGSGNHLSGKSDASLAWLPEKSPGTYAGCSAVPVKERVRMLSGLHEVNDGQRICIWTKPGRVAMLTLTRAPRQQLPDLVFDYVVWRGGAPESSETDASLPPDTEIGRYALGNVTDEKGVDFDPGGGVVSEDASGADVTPQGYGNAIKVLSGALITLLPKGSPGTYAACASVPADQRRVGVPGLHDKELGSRICVYLYSGRVAMLTMANVPSFAEPKLILNVVVWQGTAGARPVSMEPPPWIRAPLNPGETATKVRGARSSAMAPRPAGADTPP